MHALANGITSFFIGRGLLDEEHRPWYVYALESKLGQSATVLFTLAAGWALGRPLQPLLVLLAAMFLRQRAGGWHAPKAWLCQILSVGLAVLGSFAAVWCAENRPWLWLGALLAVSGLVVWALAPAGHPNLPQTPAELAANHVLARRRLCAAALAALALQVVFPSSPYGLCAVNGVFLAAVGVLVQTIWQEVRRYGTFKWQDD